MVEPIFAMYKLPRLPLNDPASGDQDFGISNGISGS